MEDHSSSAVKTIDQVDVGAHTHHSFEERFQPFRIGIDHFWIVCHLPNGQQIIVQNSIGFLGNGTRQGQVCGFDVRFKSLGGQMVK